MFKVEDYTEVKKDVKVLTAENKELLKIKYKNFENNHKDKVIETKQYCDTMMFIFYWEE